METLCTLDKNHKSSPTLPSRPLVGAFCHSRHAHVITFFFYKIMQDNLANHGDESAACGSIDRESHTGGKILSIQLARKFKSS